MKGFFRNVHLYLALVSGLVIMVTCFTGAVLVFEEELMHAFNKQRYYVEAGSEKLPADLLINNFKSGKPAATVSSFKFYSDPLRTAEISFSEDKPKKSGVPAAGKPGSRAKQGKPENGREGARKTAFLNPYTGELVGIFNYRDSFFFTMFSLHRWLLAGETGKLIVGVSTLIFLFIIITGIILWWPKTKRILLQRLKIKTGTGWKRLNHDLHIVLGFYTSLFLFVFAFTGLAWSFEWFNKGIYLVTSSSMQRPGPPKSDDFFNRGSRPVNEILLAARKVEANAVYYNINIPKDTASAYSVSLLAGNAPHETASDQLFFDQYSGKLTGTNYYKDRNLGSRVRSVFRPVHTGSIFGWSSKIIAFIVCLLGVSFPVTGIVMWINRLNKKRKSSPVKSISVMADAV